MTRRLRAGALFTAVALALSGVVALALRPASAGAAELSNRPADFTLRPGQAEGKEYSKVMIGSAEVRPNPVDCRDNPAIGLTCAAHRIKLVNRQPGYFLRISTSWLSRDAGGTSVPDIDTYLFDGDSSQYDYNQVGGVSGAMPEQIKLVDPAQDEYDVVIGAYAGAVSSYSVVVEYTNASSAPTPGITADFVLSPHDPPEIREYQKPLAVPTIAGQPPDSCRNDPTQDLVCDAYRIKLNRNTAKGAVNFVVITLDWDPVETPDLDLVALGLGGEQVPNLDMYIFDTASHALEGTGGNLFLLPERAGFVATQDEYDLTVQSKRGAGSSYTLSMFMTDEIFDKPFELLDPITGQPISEPIADDKGGFVSPVDGTVVPPLALAPVDPDEQIAGIGLGTTEQFEDALQIGRAALRPTSANSEPPSAWVLVMAMGIIPLLLLTSGVVLLRRRHHVAF